MNDKSLTVLFTTKPVASSVRYRVPSVDAIRGLALILMTLGYLGGLAEFYAPAFVFLSGTAAWFMQGRKTVKQTALFLFRRGCLLIVLQVTVVSYSWHFDLHHIDFGVLFTIGVSMIVLGGLVYLPFNLVLAIGALLICCFNLLDGMVFAAGSFAETLGGLFFVLPSIGVMALGYCFGGLYTNGLLDGMRRMTIALLGVGCLVPFVILRGINGYGDALHWAVDPGFGTTLLSFFRLTVSPPSLFFLLVSIGITLLLLAFVDGKSWRFMRPLIVFGRVSLFYYLIAVYAVHVIRFVFSTHLWVAWITLVAGLYPLCAWYARIKHSDRALWWMSYL